MKSWGRWVILAAALLGMFPLAAEATGWLDYELKLERGFSIVRANAFDIVLTRDNVILISQNDFPQIGPITDYVQKGTTLFVRAAGWTKRNKFKGDEFKNVDLSQRYYFIVTGDAPSVEGPLSEQAFNAHKLVTNASPIQWVRPKNPHVLRPLIGSLIFIGLAIPLLYLKYAFVTVPLTLLLVGVLIMRRKKK